MKAAAARAAFDRAERDLLDHYGVEANSRYVELAEPSTTLRVVESGDGPPLVLLPGAGTFGLLWAPLLPHLQDFRLIAVDLPGRGLSDRIDYRGVDVRAHGVTILRGLLDALGIETASLVAHSLGAYRALAFAGVEPARVASLCIMGAPGLVTTLDSKAPAYMRLLALPRLGEVILKAGREAQEPAAWRVFAGAEAVTALPDAFFRYSYAEGRLPGSARATTSLFGRVASARGFRPSVLLGDDDLAAVSAPTLIVWGRDDFLGGPEKAPTLAAVMPVARVEIVDGGHVPWWNDPVGCAALVRNFVPAPA